MRYWTNCAVVFLGFGMVMSCAARAAADTNKDSPAPETTDELRRAIATVLEETNTPGAGVVLISKDEVLWTAGIGVADHGAGREVTPQTMFRAGSISKTLLAVAILKLEEEGKLRLDDRLSDLVGDDLFDNPWEDSEPLRLVHLLEHTAGFDDLPVRQFAASEPEITTREALAFDKRPYKSRWRPGRFFSYSNAGYILAGHVIERVTGRSFEQYMQAEILDPLGMKTASFLLTPAVQQSLAKGYQNDGVTEAAYWHIVGRPAGSLNITPSELARLVQLLLNRGSLDGVRLVSPEVIARMETSETSLAARRGLRAGYGLGVFTTPFKGTVFYGHAGGVENYLALYGYDLEHGLGFVSMINSGNIEAAERIEHLIQAYLTRNLPPPPATEATSDEAVLRAFTGYYEPITPRMELARFVERLLGIKQVTLEDGKLVIRGVGSEPLHLLSGGQRGLFRADDESIDTVAFVEEEGESFLLGSRIQLGNFRRISAWLVFSQAALVLFCLVAMLSALLFPLVWVPRKLFGRMRGARHLSLRVFPLAAVLAIVGAFALSFVAVAEQPLARLGNPTIWSVGFCALTWLFAVTAVAGLIQAVRAYRWDVNRWVRRHALVVSLANATVLGYLAYWGIIGLQTWT